MITELFEEESVKPDLDLPNSMSGYQDVIKPAQIQICQVGSIKPMTKEQVRKCLWQHGAEERKEISLIFRQGKMCKKPQKMATPVQIHMLRMPKMQKGLPAVWVRILKTKPATKEQARKSLQ